MPFLFVFILTALTILPGAQPNFHDSYYQSNCIEKQTANEL